MSFLKAMTITNAGKTGHSKDCFVSKGFVPDYFSQESAGSKNLEHSVISTTRSTVCFAIFDGIRESEMSGVAARMAAEELAAETERAVLLALPEMNALIRRYIARVNEHFDHAIQVERSLAGMGTAFICLCLHGNQAVIFNNGNCRAYLFRQGKLQKVGEPKVGAPDNGAKSDYLGSPAGKGLSRYTATDLLPLENNDRFLLLSDGLAESLNEGEMETCLTAAGPEQAASQLMAKALAHGGSDSLTITVVDLSETAEEHPVHKTNAPGMDQPQSAHPHVEHHEKPLSVTVEKQTINPDKMKFRRISIWQVIPQWLQVVLTIGLILLILFLIWVLYPHLFQ